MALSQAVAYAQAHRARFVRELQQFVQFPSVSTQPQHAPDVQRCAEWLARHLREIGMEHARVIATARHPIVYGAWRRAPSRPTVLIYGHYDVQPAEPLNAWRDPPFSATIRGDALYGRGASDDKGQLWAHLKAIEAWFRAAGKLPVNVVCVIDGEEEIGSPNLQRFLQSEPHIRTADVAVMSDTRFRAPGQPALIYALRGSLGLELEVRGPLRDLHSGSFGGAIHNPVQVLCEMIARLHEANGRITIPGFYDRVRPVDAAERRYLARHGPPNSAILREAGSERGWGERGYSLYERTTIRPALTINGITGGYQGAGDKSIIPSRALAKLSFRLVPDQAPREIEQLFRQHITRITPPTACSRLRTNFRAMSALIDPRQPAMQAAVAAYRRGFGTSPVLLRSGGTIPVVNMFQSLFGIPTVLMGFALPNDRMHAPNERFHLPQLYNGILTAIAFLHELSLCRSDQVNAERAFISSENVHDY